MDLKNNELLIQSNADKDSRLAEHKYQYQLGMDRVTELEQKEHKLKMENEGLQNYINNEVPSKIKQEKKIKKESKKKWKDRVEDQQKLKGQWSLSIFVVLFVFRQDIVGCGQE